MQTSKPVTFIPRRDSHENWLVHNPVLKLGELAYDYDTNLFRIGDGVRHWRDLPPFEMPTKWYGYSPEGQLIFRFKAHD